MAGLLEQIGWSDETEMLAKIYAFCLKKFGGVSISWEDCLPAKYTPAARYSLVQEVNAETDATLGAALKSGLEMYSRVMAENKRFGK